MIEGEQVNMPTGHTYQGTGNFAVGGTEGIILLLLNARGLVWTGTDFDQVAGSAPFSQGGLTEFDTILQELDKQGAIEENMMFLIESYL